MTLWSDAFQIRKISKFNADDIETECHPNKLLNPRIYINCADQLAHIPLGNFAVMNAARPGRSLVGRCISSARTRTVPSVASSNHFHTSAPHHKNRRSQFRNVKAEDMGLLKPQKMKAYQEENYSDYTPEEMELLRKKYTPEQLEALQAGEKAIDPKDMIIQGRLRDDMFRPIYIEDYTVLDPRYDLKPELEGTPSEPKWPDEDHFEQEYFDKLTGLIAKKSGDQLTKAMMRALRKVKLSQGEDLIDLTEEELDDMERDPSLLEKYLVSPEQEKKDIKKDDKALLTRAKALKLDELVDKAWKHELDQITNANAHPELRPQTLELTGDGPDGAIRAHTAEAFELGKVPGVAGLYKTTTAEEDAQDDQGQYTELKQLTGMSLEQLKSIYTKIIVVRFVHNQTRLGKIRSLSVMAIAGNGHGRLGIGVGKSTQMDVASSTATMLAIRNMKPLRRYENRTIYGNIKSKVSGTIVELSARPPGMLLVHPTIEETNY